MFKEAISIVQFLAHRPKCQFRHSCDINLFELENLSRVLSHTRETWFYSRLTHRGVSTDAQLVLSTIIIPLSTNFNCAGPLGLICGSPHGLPVLESFSFFEMTKKNSDYRQVYALIWCSAPSPLACARCFWPYKHIFMLHFGAKRSAAENGTQLVSCITFGTTLATERATAERQRVEHRRKESRSDQIQIWFKLPSFFSSPLSIYWTRVSDLDCFLMDFLNKLSLSIASLWSTCQIHERKHWFSWHKFRCMTVSSIGFTWSAAVIAIVLGLISMILVCLAAIRLRDGLETFETHRIRYYIKNMGTTVMSSYEKFLTFNHQT